MFPPVFLPDKFMQHTVLGYAPLPFDGRDRAEDIVYRRKSCVLERVKTSNMGTLYELTYRVTLPDDHAPKAFLDELRCRNGNLNIICGREATKDAL